MPVHELPFAKIDILREDIAEVMINDGVEMNLAIVDQYHKFLLAHLRAPFSLLINKVNSYSYDFPAQSQLATLIEINAMAVVTYSRASALSTETLAAFPRDVKWNMRMFKDRDQALAWLASEQDKINAALYRTTDGAG